MTFPINGLSKRFPRLSRLRLTAGGQRAPLLRCASHPRAAMAAIVGVDKHETKLSAAENASSARLRCRPESEERCSQAKKNYHTRNQDVAASLVKSDVMAEKNKPRAVLLERFEHRAAPVSVHPLFLFLLFRLSPANRRLLSLLRMCSQLLRLTNRTPDPRKPRRPPAKLCPGRSSTSGKG